MTELVQSEIVPGPSEVDPISSQMQAAEVVLAYLENTRLARRSRAYEVLRALASLTRQRLERGQSTEISTQALKVSVAPEASKEPSAWLSPHWAALLKAEAGWQEGMASEARRLGVEFVPKLEKLPGNPTHYRLLSVPLRPEEAPSTVSPIPEGGIYYTVEAVAAPGGWFAKTLRAGVVPWILPLRWSMFLVLMISLTALGTLAWLVLNEASHSRGPVSPADVTVMVLFVASAWIATSVFRYFVNLFDLRLMMAPTVLTPLTMDNVTLELRPSLDDGPGEMIFARYTSTCPICQGTVVLFEGGKAFPDRIIGRCRRSGREHIFSFDHVSRVGHPLRQAATFAS